MKILFVSSMFFKKSSSASIRNISLVNGLVENGCEVTVLTIKYPDEVLDPYLRKNINTRVKIVDVYSGFISKYIPKKKVSKYKNKFFYKLKEFIKSIVYFPDVDKVWIKSVPYDRFKKFDVLISSSDTKTSHFVASIINKRIDVEWLQIWGDPWHSDIHNHYFFHKIRASFFEKKILKEANKIVYVSKPTLEYIQKQYPFTQNKSYYVPRGYINAIKGYDLAGKTTLNICYTGVLRGRNIYPLISKIKEHNMKNKIQLCVNVYGRVSEDIVSKYNSFDCLSFHGEKNLEEIYDIYSEVDILLFIGNRSSSTQIPGKLYDYFGTDRTILVLLEDISGDIADFIKKTNRCIIFENKENSINIDLLLKQIREERVLEAYSPVKIAQGILEVIN